MVCLFREVIFSIVMFFEKAGCAVKKPSIVMVKRSDVHIEGRMIDCGASVVGA